MKNRKEIYIDARGDVLPCCWVGSDWVEHPIKEKLTIQQLRNKMRGVFNCYGLPEEDDEDNYIIYEDDDFEGKVGEKWLIKRLTKARH